MDIRVMTHFIFMTKLQDGDIIFYEKKYSCEVFWNSCFSNRCICCHTLQRSKAYLESRTFAFAIANCFLNFLATKLGSRWSFFNLGVHLGPIVVHRTGTSAHVLVRIKYLLEIWVGFAYSGLGPFLYVSKSINDLI